MQSVNETRVSVDQVVLLFVQKIVGFKQKEITNAGCLN